MDKAMVARLNEIIRVEMARDAQRQRDEERLQALELKRQLQRSIDFENWLRARG